MPKILVCKMCGWKSKEYSDKTAFIGPGGILGCPECKKRKEYRGLEGTYGRVEIVIKDQEGYKCRYCKKKYQEIDQINNLKIYKCSECNRTIRIKIENDR